MLLRLFSMSAEQTMDIFDRRQIGNGERWEGEFREGHFLRVVGDVSDGNLLDDWLFDLFNNRHVLDDFVGFRYCGWKLN